MLHMIVIVLMFIGRPVCALSIEDVALSQQYQQKRAIPPRISHKKIIAPETEENIEFVQNP